MKNKSILLPFLSFAILFATNLSAQTPPNTFQMNKNAAIQFYDSDGTLDSTEIVRKGGNSLRFRYNSKPLLFEAYGDKHWRILNSLGETSVQFDPKGNKSFIMGRLGINTDWLEGYQLKVDGNTKSDEVHLTKIKFFDSGDTLDGTEIIKANGNALRIKYFGNKLIFDALDDQPMQLHNASNTPTLRLHPNGNSYFLGGNIGIGTTNPQTPLHLNQADEKGLRFERENHAIYELRLEGSTGFHVKNLTTGNSEMVFNENGRIGIGTTMPLGILHLKQPDEHGLRFERIDHQSYDIGLRGNKGLYFTNTQSGNYEMVFDGNGKVGIGTESPTGRLHIYADSSANDASTAGIGGYIVLGKTNALNLAIDNNEIIARNNGGVSNLGLQTDGGAVTIHGGDLVTEESRKVHISNLGQVGIGTLQPSAPLEIKQTRPLIVLNDTDNTDTLQPRLEIHNNNTMVFNGTDVSNDQIYRFYPFYSSDRNHDAVLEILGKQTGGWNNKLILTHDGSNGMVKTGAGNLVLQPENGAGQVAINTSVFPTDTDFKLAVNGKIISTEVKVQNITNWPDYVFAKDYPLLPLEQLEANIQQNGHLPGIPSAEDVKEKGGVEVGDMQQRLLEKVEELTLYIIQLEKRVKELERKE